MAGDRPSYPFIYRQKKATKSTSFRKRVAFVALVRNRYVFSAGSIRLSRRLRASPVSFYQSRLLPPDHKVKKNTRNIVRCQVLMENFGASVFVKTAVPSIGLNSCRRLRANRRPDCRDIPRNPCPAGLLPARKSLRELFPGVLDVFRLLGSRLLSPGTRSCRPRSA